MARLSADRPASCSLRDDASVEIQPDQPAAFDRVECLLTSDSGLEAFSMLDRSTVDSLFPSDLPETQQWEMRYPPRGLPAGALVTRLCPSPTGYAHIGLLYVATIDLDLARHSGGVYFIRIEDTDQNRSVADAEDQFSRVFDYFGITSQESGNDTYGPYRQSDRALIYLSYVRELLRQGQAYPCFASSAELAQLSEQQRTAKVPTGYYGRWALWRDRDPGQVEQRLAAGDPYVVRFRAPDDAAGLRTHFTDAIRGRLEHEANRNDAVILKSSDRLPRLPTYHFAHAIDDHLMRVNLVIRGDEWISSVPLHQQLFTALGFDPIQYAHIAPLMKQIPGGKRKLSKRKDPEANVDFYLEAGYPAPAVLYYLRGLANGRLAELPLPDALAAPIHLAECGVAGPLVDLVKLDDISADYIATVPTPELFAEIQSWASRHDAPLAEVLRNHSQVALQALAMERDGADNPRKDLRKWSDFRQAYGFFFDEFFTPLDGADDHRLQPVGIQPVLATQLAEDFATHYQPSPDGPWFDQIRELASRHGFAANARELKKNPAKYPGSIREASQLIRVALSGSTRSPDLQAVAEVLGAERVIERIRAIKD